jgi:hypothetical protein
MVNSGSLAQGPQAHGPRLSILAPPLSSPSPLLLPPPFNPSSHLLPLSRAVFACARPVGWGGDRQDNGEPRASGPQRAQRPPPARQLAALPARGRADRSQHDEEVDTVGGARAERCWRAGWTRAY